MEIVSYFSFENRISHAFNRAHRGLLAVVDGPRAARLPFAPRGANRTSSDWSSFASAHRRRVKLTCFDDPCPFTMKLVFAGMVEPH